MSSEKRYEPRYSGDFWSQAPVVLFAAAAVLAILFVNVRSHQAGQHKTATHPAAPAEKSAHTGPPGVADPCSDCGVVVSIERVGAEAAVAVRLRDGSLVSVRYAGSSIAVGDAVHVNGDVLADN